MTRLIDADALKEFVIGISREAKKNKSSPGTAIIYDMCVQFANMINNAPTIDAIPVEWLIRKRDSIHPAVTVGSATDWLLDEWQKEQEAR